MKILFVYQELVSFVEKDLDILRSRHHVKEFLFSGLKDIFLLFIEVVRHDLCFCWFGKLHAFFVVFFSKLLNKKTIVIAGGDDVANEPDIEYGMFSSWWQKWFPLFVFKYADLVIPVSQSNLRETIENAGSNPSRTKLLYHGFDSQKWQRTDRVSKENLVLTVGRVTNETFRKKGLDLFVRSAAYLPNVSFVLVGPWLGNAIDRLRTIASPNVAFIGGLYGEDLLQMYSRAKVYVQASVHESFGCSVAEAMLCECVPVVSRRTALPEVVGDCGFYAHDQTPESLAWKIKEALSAPNDLGEKARHRIKTYFPLEKRKKDLLETIDSLNYS